MSPKSWAGGYKRCYLEVTGGSDPVTCKGTESDDVQEPASSSSENPTKFRKTLANLFLSNKLSALQTKDLASGATDAGAVGSEDLGKATYAKNAHRDILRNFLKDSCWPSEYWAPVELVDPETCELHTVDFPFLLPHEVLHHLLKNNPDALRTYAADPNTPLGSVVRDSCSRTGLDPKTTLPIGLHGDGAPFAAKMRDSLEQFSWNLCSHPTSTRIVFTAIPKKFVGPRTMEQILSVLTWSMKCLKEGIMPCCRHDGTEFNNIDNKRTKNISSRATLARQSIGATACLVQVRGDWAFYKSVFHVPSWSSDQICWLCKATRLTGSTFDFRGKAWRNARYTEDEFPAILLAAGMLSVIFQCPGFIMKYILIDWLHAVDLGVGQTIIGNLFHEVCELLPGPTRKDRVDALWQKLRTWYKSNKPPSKLDGLTPEMIKQPGKKTKLRCKAGECRYLIPFAASLAQEFDDGSCHRNTVNVLLQKFLEVSVCLNTEPYDAKKAADACNKVCRLHVALELMSRTNGNDLGWCCKPKLHMMEELICFVGPEFGSPRHFWTYQDESWGGWLANAATRRGGPKFASACALNLLQRYRAVVSSDI